MSLVPGDTISVTPGSGSTSIQFEGGGETQSCGFFLTSTSCAGASFVAGATANYTLEEVSGRLGATLTCSAGSATCGGTDTGGGGTSTTEPAARKVQSDANRSAFVAATGASKSIDAAIGTALNAGPAAQVSRNGLFLSTNGGASMPEAWVSLQGRSYNGGVDGRSFELTTGIDFHVTRSTRLGFVVSADRADPDTAGTSVETTALRFGPYFKTELNDTFSATGYALFARPEYDVAGTTYTADRRAAGLTLNASHFLGATKIDSFLGVSGFREEHPSAGALSARWISSTTGSIGTKATFGTDSAFRPYLGISADFNRFEDGSGTTRSHTSPRIGAGFVYDAGAGQVTFDVNGGEIIEDTRDIQMRLGYSLQF